ncbi:MHYT domain-containing protein [Streptomyces hebeiensis]
MYGTIDGFSYGLVTPVAAFLMACLGSVLGLRCVTRSLFTERTFKPGWLGLGAACIGSGIWTMHFIAMVGFRVMEAPISYDVPTTVLSLVVAVTVVGVGVFIAGYGGGRRAVLICAGVFMGAGIAAMHYIGMSGMRMHGQVEYALPGVVASVVIAVAAATAALWAAVSIQGFLPSLGASGVMGLAVSGMHYTAMASVSVRLEGIAGVAPEGGSPTSLLFPMLIGPVVFMVVAGVVVMFDPLLVLGEGEWNRPEEAKSPREEPPRRPVWPSLPEEESTVLRAGRHRAGPRPGGRELGGR